MTKRAKVLNKFIKDQTKYKAYAYTLTLDWSIAEDATQETVVYLCDHWNKFELGTNFNAWARVLIKNRCRELLRKEYKEQKKINKIAEVIEDSVWDEVENYNSEKIKALHNCVNKLSEKSKKIFNMFYKEKIKCQIISKFLKITEDATYKILSRTRNNLKTCINNQIKEIQ